MSGRYSRELLELAPQPTTAELVLRVAEDPNADGHRLARVIETDPALAARVLRLANSAYYGASRKVASVQHAVVMLGFPTVRALALSAALGVLDEAHDPGPLGFWPHALSTAAAASVIAKRLAHNTADAFTAGLLHDVGAMLLYRRNPRAFAATQMAGDGTRITDILLAELSTFGTTHTQAGAAALDAWGLPGAVVEAVATHHGADEPRHTLGRILRTAQAVALVVLPSPGHADEHDVPGQLAEVGLPAATASRILDETRATLAQLTLVLGGGA